MASRRRRARDTSRRRAMTRRTTRRWRAERVKLLAIAMASGLAIGGASKRRGEARRLTATRRSSSAGERESGERRTAGGERGDAIRGTGDAGGDVRDVLVRGDVRTDGCGD